MDVLDRQVYDDIARRRKMSKIGEIMFDIIPGPVYRFWCRVRDWPRERKWKRQRAKRILPECDCWDFHYTLVMIIHQGMEYLLRDDCPIDYDYDAEHKKMKQAFEYILNWTYLYENMLDAQFELEPDEYAKAEKEYSKVQTKAFKLIDKYLGAMWD